MRYVALPGVELDPAGRAEGALVRGGPVPGLREVWRVDALAALPRRGRAAARDAAGARHARSARTP